MDPYARAVAAWPHIVAMIAARLHPDYDDPPTRPSEVTPVCWRMLRAALWEAEQAGCFGGGSE